jgi:FkbM family methyltransferase
MKAAFPSWLIDLDDERAWEPELTAALERVTRPGSVCVDLGAHVGYFTLLMARLSGPHGTVTAFEASADNATLVERSVRLNGLEDRVTVEHAAVTDGEQAEVALYAGASGGSMEWTTDAAFAARGAGEAADVESAARVPAVALDSYFAPGTPLDVVKMDIEGGEAGAVRGMTRLLREARPVIVLEFHREVGWPAIPLLQDASYSFSDLAGEPVGPFSGPEAVPYQLVAMPPARA